MVHLLKVYLLPPLELLYHAALPKFCVIFPFTGFLINKPEVIFRLEEGEEPWIVKEEFLYQNHPGELVSTRKVSEEARRDYNLSGQFRSWTFQMFSKNLLVAPTFQVEKGYIYDKIESEKGNA